MSKHPFKHLNSIPHKWCWHFNVCKRCGLYKEEFEMLPMSCTTHDDKVLSFELGRLRRLRNEIYKLLPRN